MTNTAVSKKKKKKFSLTQLMLIVFSAFTLAGFAVFFSIQNVVAATITGLSVGGITAEYDNGTWSANGDSITGSVTGTSGCSDSATTANLTIKASKSNSTLSFDYSMTLNGGTITIGGSSVSSSGSYSKSMNSNETLKIVVKSDKGSSKTTKFNMTNIVYEFDATITGTFAAPSPSNGGTYTINGTDYASFSPNPYSYSVKETSITVTAIPNSNHYFFGWMDGNGNLLSRSTTQEITMAENYTLYPMFYSKTDSMYYINGVYKNTLSSAISYAESSGNKVICVETDNAFVPAGDYTIKSGYTLLVPYESTRKNTISDTPNYSSGAAITGTSQFQVYKKLTLLNGANINVQGNICVNGFLAAHNNYYNGVTYTTYGYMYMSEGSTIRVKSSGRIYCYGYISGDGEIIAENGAKIYEPFQINDYRGGTQTSNMAGSDKSYKVFPFTQFFIQNIEAKLTLNYGSSLFAVAVIKATSYTSTTKSVINFIGPSGTSTKYLLSMDSGCVLSKKYDPSTDRNIFDISGNAAISTMSMTVYVSVDSKDFVVPLMQNMTFNVHSGTLTLAQSVCLIPGCQINIDEGATIISSASVYVYDRDQWVGHYYVFTNQFSAAADKCLSVALFSPTRKAADKMTHADMLDAEINVNGTLIFGSGGSFYTTAGGANIHSSTGEGTIRFEGSSISGSATTYQCLSNSSYDPITVTSAQLKNMDDATYTSTSGTAAGEFYNIHKKTGVWTKGYQPSYFDIKIYDEDNSTLVYSYNDFPSGDSFTFPSIGDTTLSDTSAFKFWTDGENIYSPGDVIGELIGLSGSTKTFRAFKGGWFGSKYYRYDISGTDPVKGFWTIGDNPIRDYKKLSDESEPIPYHSTCYFDETTGILDTDGTTYEMGTTILFMPEKIILNTVDNNYYLILGGVLQKNRGLFEHINGNYYYFGEANFAYKDGTFYVSNTNDLTYNDQPIQPGYYYFDELGIMDIEGSHATPKERPTYIDNGVAYVTYNTEVADNYGLFAYNNNLYYAGANGVLVASTSFYVNSDMINGCTIGEVAVTEGLYYFDQQGRMYDSQLNLITNGGQTV